MFLHPLIIAAGVLAAGLPVAIHFLTRPRPIRYPLSTIRFVQDALRQRRARHRLRDALILALRTLAILLLGAAIARPLIGRHQRVSSNDESDTTRIVILDTSQSLAADSSGVQAFERARPLASRHLQYHVGLKANLILAGAAPTAVFPTPSTNFAALRDELASAEPQPQQSNAQIALNMAGEMLAASPQNQRLELVVISDFQRANWSSVDFSVVPEGTEITLESVGPEKAAPNLALLSAGSNDRAEVGREVRLEAAVGNYSPSPRRVRVEIRLGDAAFQLEGDCPPYNTTVLSTTTVPQNTGWQIGEARLVDVHDALEADNVRGCVLGIRPVPTFALVTRQAADQRPSSSYFIERAIAPAESRTGSAKIVRMNTGALDREALAGADLIIIDHAGRLSDDAIGVLASMLRRGRGLLYVAAETIDADNLRRLAEAIGSGWRLPIQLAAPPTSQPRRGLFMTEVQRSHQTFAIFGDNLNTLAAPLRFAGGLATRRIEPALPEQTLAELNDGSALLSVGSADISNVAILNADLEQSNLPGSTLFVPLLNEVVQQLLGSARTVEAWVCGEPFAVYVPIDVATADGLEIRGPSGADTSVGELLSEPNGLLWRTPAAERPGVYRILRRDDTVFAAVAAIPESESDLRTLSGEVFQQRLSGGRKLNFQSAYQGAQESQDTLWTWLAVGCVLCICGELLTLRFFRT